MYICTMYIMMVKKDHFHTGQLKVMPMPTNLISALIFIPGVVYFRNGNHPFGFLKTLIEIAKAHITARKKLNLI